MVLWSNPSRAFSPLTLEVIQDVLPGQQFGQLHIVHGNKHQVL